MANAARAYRAPYAQESVARPVVRPRVHVVPGRREDTLSAQSISMAKIAIVAIIVLAVLAVGRLALSAATVDVAIASESTQTQIESLRSQSGNLEVQASYLSNPAYVKDVATKQLGMGAAVETATVNVAEDAVATDDAGNLSLSESMAAASLRE